MTTPERSRQLSHEETQELLAAAALGALPPEEVPAAMAHIAGCEECRRDLRELRETAAALAYAAPAVSRDAERSARVRARLMARVGADRQTAAEPRPLAADTLGGPPQQQDASAASPVRRRADRPTERTVGSISRRPLAPWLALAASVAFVIAAVGAARVAGQRDAARQALASERAAAANRGRELSAALAERDQILAALTGPSVTVVDLATAGPRAPSARMFWDRATNRWTMFAHNLPMPPSGRTYQLWLVTKQGKISAGVFAPNSRGDAMVRAEYQLTPDVLEAIAVTQEPAGGMPQPTGPIVIAGSVARG